MELETTESAMDDFFSAFDTGEETPVTEEAETEPNTTVEDADSGGAEAAESEENGEQEESQEPAEDSAQEPEAAENAEESKMYEIITDGKPESVSLEELKIRAQKGGAFDRVKGQLEQARQTIQEMTAAKEKTQQLLDLFQFAAEKSGVTLEELPENVYSAFVRSKGGTDAQAKAEMENFKLQRRLDAKDAEKTTSAEKAADDERTSRAEADLKEFHQLFPDVKLNDALTDEVKANIQKGMSIANAYQKMLNDKKAAEIEQQRKQMAAEEKNRKNRRTSPGNQKSGGGGTNDPMSDFFSILNS